MVDLLICLFADKLETNQPEIGLRSQSGLHPEDKVPQ